MRNELHGILSDRRGSKVLSHIVIHLRVSDVIVLLHTRRQRKPSTTFLRWSDEFHTVYLGECMHYCLQLQSSTGGC